MLNYENAAAPTSETDDETTVCSDGDGVDREDDLGGPADGVPSLQASPPVGHALLSLKGAEGLHQRWRLGDHIDDPDAHRTGSGESHDLFERGHLCLAWGPGLPRGKSHLCSAYSHTCSTTQASTLEGGLRGDAGGEA